jgi:hypothetical protein
MFVPLSQTTDSHTWLRKPQITWTSLYGYFCVDCRQTHLRCVNIVYCLECQLVLWGIFLIKLVLDETWGLWWPAHVPCAWSRVWWVVGWIPMYWKSAKWARSICSHDMLEVCAMCCSSSVGPFCWHQIWSRVTLLQIECPKIYCTK